jgi:hypothetical protein
MFSVPFDRFLEKLVSAILPLVVWFVDDCPFFFYANRCKVIPEGIWEAYVAYTDNEPVVTEPYAELNKYLGGSPSDPIVSITFGGTL